MKQFGLKCILLIFVMMFLSALVVTAQDDGRANTSGADRVVAYCRTNSLEVWGTDTLGVGFYMANISYADLLAPGTVVRLTRYGQVQADASTDGSIAVFWLGGEFGATGTGDFEIRIQCALPIIVPSLATSTPTPYHYATGTVTYPTTITAMPTPVNTANNCNYTRTHTVSAGENLFRIGLRYGVNFTTLAACNNISDPTRIYVGQQIRVP